MGYVSPKEEVKPNGPHSLWPQQEF